MSNMVNDPEIDCSPVPGDRHHVQILTSRDVPLGGPRAMTVHRTLPQRDRSLIGAWCFADHYGPADVRDTGGLDVPPHPHTGLQTVSWLFTGEIEHRDSSGVHTFVRPGEVNLMTAGHGIAHSEVSTPDTTTLHGVQLWVALPDESRDTARNFEHFVPEPIAVDGGRVSVFIGDLLGKSSPVATFSPLLGAQIDLDMGASVTIPVHPTFEHGVLVDQGSVSVEGAEVGQTELAYLAPGHHHITLQSSDERPCTLILLGGRPFGEDLVMWWNFVGRSHEEIVDYRTQWQAGADRFGHVEGYVGGVDRLPAPALPNARIKPRPTAEP
ncbi:MAG: pirin family protein [Microbacteriaceae bacterium]